MIAQLYTFTKNHWIVYLWYMNFKAIKLLIKQRGADHRKLLYMQRVILSVGWAMTGVPAGPRGTSEQLQKFHFSDEGQWEGIPERQVLPWYREGPSDGLQGPMRDSDFCEVALPWLRAQALGSTNGGHQSLGSVLGAQRLPRWLLALSLALPLSGWANPLSTLRRCLSIQKPGWSLLRF